MYDPFGSPPPSGTVATPQYNQVLPNPIPVSTNNALAALYNKHMNAMSPSGMTPPNGQFPLNPGGPIHGQMMPDWRQQFQQARMDWRGARPDQQGFAGDWQGQMQDWRQQRPVKRDYRMGTVPPAAV